MNYFRIKKIHLAHFHSDVCKTMKHFPPKKNIWLEVILVQMKETDKKKEGEINIFLMFY